MEDQNINLKVIPPKDYLPKVAIAVAGALIIFLAVLTISGIIEAINKVREGRYIGQGAQYKNTISISGEGKVLSKPDIGQVDLSVISNAKTVAVAQKDNTDKMNKITQSMKDLGIKEEDLKTASYNIYPQYQYTAGRSLIIGYEVSQTLEVKIRDLEKVGAILGKAAELGANQVGSLTFTFDDPEKLNAQARQEAIDNAKEKAQDLAKSLGVSLGKVVSFSESSSGMPTPIYYAKELSSGMGGGGAAPDVQTGQNEVNVIVNIAYEIY
jgi:uncharacterized protein YggE